MTIITRKVTSSAEMFMIDDEIKNKKILERGKRQETRGTQVKRGAEIHSDYHQT